MKITNFDPMASAALAAGAGGIGSPTGGDLSGPLPNPTVVAIQGVAIDATPGITGDVLTLVDATHADWEPPAGGGGGNPPTRLLAAELWTLADRRQATFAAPIVLGVGSGIVLGSESALIEVH